MFRVKISIRLAAGEKKKKTMLQTFGTCCMIYHRSSPIPVHMSVFEAPSTPLALAGNNYQPLLRVSLQHVSVRKRAGNGARISSPGPFALAIIVDGVSRERCLCTHGVFHWASHVL